MSNKKLKKTVIPIRGDLDPNNWESRDVVEKVWLDNADFYDDDWMPHILKFGSLEELNRICNETDFEEVSRLMEIKNVERKKRVYEMWKGIIDEIKS